MKVIIYTTDGFQNFAVVTPAPQCELPIEMIAKKDVPHGVAFWIRETYVNEQNEIAFEYPKEGDAPDGYGSDFGVGSDYDAVGWTEQNLPLITIQDDDAVGHFILDQNDKKIPVEVEVEHDNIVGYKTIAKDPELNHDDGQAVS